MSGSHIGVGSHWLKRSCRSPRISRTRPATSGASSNRLSRARGSSGLCITPRLPVHSKKRVRMSASFSGLNVSWSSIPGHAVVGTLMCWSRWRNISLARAPNEGCAELCMGNILKSRSSASPESTQCAAITPSVRLWRCQVVATRARRFHHCEKGSDKLAILIALWRCTRGMRLVYTSDKLL